MTDPKLITRKVNRSAQASFIWRRRRNPSQDPAVLESYADAAMEEAIAAHALERHPAGDSERDPRYAWYDCYLTPDKHPVYLMHNLGTFTIYEGKFESKFFDAYRPF